MKCPKQYSFHFSDILTAAVFILSAILFLQNLKFFSKTTSQTQADSLQNSLVRSAVHCYAAEGFYPESLEYLQEEYGIYWDPKQYAVDYEVFASNRLPAISVIPLS